MAKNEIFKYHKEEYCDDYYRYGLNPLMGITKAVNKCKKDYKIEHISK